jgi:hypothetical protein
VIRDWIATFTALKNIAKELLIIIISLWLLLVFLTHQPRHSDPDPNPPRPAVTGPPAHHNTAP